MDPSTNRHFRSDPGAMASASQILPLVYDELRALAAQKLAQERPDHTLQATALVHEAYLRLLGGDPTRIWDNRGHFFAAAAEAMRRILVESARRKRLAPRITLDAIDLSAPPSDDRLLELQDALESLESLEPLAGKIAELRLFAGLTVEEAADTLQLSRATAYREWTFARAWLSAKLSAHSAQK